MAALALSRCCSFSLRPRPRPPRPTYKSIQSKLNPKVILKRAKLVVHQTSDLFDTTAFVTDVMSELFIRKIDAGSKSSDAAMIGLVVMICVKAISFALRNSIEKAKEEKEKAKEEKEKAAKDGLDG